MYTYIPTQLDTYTFTITKPGKYVDLKGSTYHDSGSLCTYHGAAWNLWVSCLPQHGCFSKLVAFSWEPDKSPLLLRVHIRAPVVHLKLLHQYCLLGCLKQSYKQKYTYYSP